MDSGFQQVLPYIRPRSGELGWLGLLVGGMLLALLVGSVLTWLATIWRRRTQTRRSFFAAAAERQLSPKHTQLLYDISRQHGMRDPLLLLTSLRTFDQHAGRVAEGGDKRRLKAVGAARMRLGFDTPSVQQRFYTTRTLAPGQKLMVWPHGQEAGFIQCVVVDRDERAITAVPLRRDDDRLLSNLQAGDQIKVRFWRDGDTEYRFRTDILEVESDRTSIRIRHAETLERVQQRDFYRVRVGRPLGLYALPPGIEDLEPDKVSAAATDRLDGTLLDISGGGLSFFDEKPVPRQGELVVDPDYDGPFPIAGAHLLLVEQHQQPEGWRVRLQFVELPASVKDDLVAAIFDFELNASV